MVVALVNAHGESLSSEQRPAMLDGVHMSESQLRAIIDSEAANVPAIGGRPTDATKDSYRNRGLSSVIPRRNEKSWKVRADRTTLTTLRIIMDRDPDVAKAVENFILLVGKGYKSVAYKRTENADTKTEDKRAQQRVDQWDQDVGNEYGGGIESLIPVWVKTLLWHGANANELEMAANLRKVLDIHPVSPDVIVFKRDPETGNLRRGVMVPRSKQADLQAQGITLDTDGFMELPERQFQYVPYHPHVNEPYGTSPLVPVIAAIFFKVELLEDARMAIHVNGHGRLDVSISRDALYKSMPANLTRIGMEDKAREWVRERIREVSNNFQSIGSDESFFHDDSATAKDIAPKVIPDLKDIMAVIDNQVIAGTKQLPILLGRNEGATTTHATVQWQLFAVQVEAFARIIARIIDWAHEEMLAAEGIAAYTVTEFEPIRASDRLQDEQARSALIANWIASIQQGWADHEEASMDVLGHPPVAEPEPPPVPPTAPIAPDEGSGGGSDSEGEDDGTEGTGEQSGTDGDREPPSQRGRGGSGIPVAEHGRGGVQGRGGEGDDFDQHESHAGPSGSGNPAEQADRHHGDPRSPGNGGITTGVSGSRWEVEGTGGQVPPVPDQFGPVVWVNGRHGPELAILPEGSRILPPANPGGPDADDLAGLAYTKEYESITIEEGTEAGDRTPQFPPRARALPDDVETRATATVNTLDDLADKFVPDVARLFADLEDEYDAAKAVAAEDGGVWFETAPGRRWLAGFRDILTNHYKAVFNVRGAGVLDELAIEGVFDLANPDAIRVLEEMCLDRVTGMNDETIATLERVIAAGIESGDHPTVIAKAIRDAIGNMSKARSETIARTETAQAYSHAAIESYRRNGVERKIWLTAEDNRVDPPCPSHEEEGSIPIDQLFGGTHDHPPAHPRCRCALLADPDSRPEDAPTWKGE